MLLHSFGNYFGTSGTMKYAWLQIAVKSAWKVKTLKIKLNGKFVIMIVY